MEEVRKITIEDVLKMSLDTLRGMQIRMDEYEQIGGPVAHVMHNLGECIAAIERDKAEAQEREPEEKPVLSPWAHDPLDEDERNYIRDVGRIGTPGNRDGGPQVPDDQD